MAIFWTGSTGRSTGPHLDMRVWDEEGNRYVDPTAFKPYVTSNGRTLDDFKLTSPYGEDRDTYTHQGVDFATEINTPFEVAGNFLTTFNDEGGGITNQYAIDHDGRSYEILLMHGSDKNRVLSDGARTDGSPSITPAAGTPTSDRSGARERAQNYAEMSKAELNEAYDAMRSNTAGAESEGMKMHKAFFNKK